MQQITNTEQQRTEIPQSMSISLSVTDDIRRSIRTGEDAITVAEAYIIDSQEMCSLAVDEMNGNLNAIDNLKKLKKGFVKPAEEIVNNAKALFDPAIRSLESATSLLKSAISRFQITEQLRIDTENNRLEEQRRREQQDAQAKASAVTARADALAESARKEAQQAEDERKKAEQSGDKKSAASLAARAAELNEKASNIESNGQHKAVEIQTRTAAAMPTPVTRIAPKMEGATLRDNWVAELIDGVSEDKAKEMIVNAAATRPELLGLLKLNTGAVNSLAKALKANFSVPGYKAVNNKIVAGKRK